MPPGRALLIAGLGFIGALEVRGITNLEIDTLSALWADVFGVEHAAGRWAFMACYVPACVALGHHIWTFRQGEISPKDHE